MTRQPLSVTREQILAFRRRVGAIDERLPAGPASLRTAAWAGLQDSMPRAALLSIHARVEGTRPSTWEDPSLVQLWGPRFSAYVVPAPDLYAFSLGRLPDEGPARRLANETADRLDAFLAGRRMDARDVARGLNWHPNPFRYGASTGRLLIRWDGAHQPIIWTVAPPDVDPFAARLELARRHLHVFGPTNADAFSDWAGIKPPRASAAFDALRPELTTVRTPIGKRLILSSDEQALRAPAGPVAPARLLPSGDAFWLLHGADRELMVPDPALRAKLWTPRVWPGALFVGGDIAGTWRRAAERVTIQSWRTLAPAERDAVVAEAESLPLPGLRGPITVRWAE